MSQNIEAIFLDTGNTLRVVVEDAALQENARQQLAKLVGTEEAPEAFYKRLDERHTAYKKLAKGTLLQVSELELWTRWLLPDYPVEKIAPLISQLMPLWHNRHGRVVPRPDAKQTIIALNKRGYHLGIIANALSETEIPNWLEADGLTQYFKTVVLSSKFGRRKPDRNIFLEAAYLIGINPAHCAYVGDNPNRDIQGARQAGFGMVVILLEQAMLEKEPAGAKYKPDANIQKLTDLLNLFPAR